MTQLTKEEKKVQNALNQLWFGHYTKDIPLERRKHLADSFAGEYLDRLTTGIDLFKPTFYHPMNSQKGRYDDRKYTAMDILADFIMRTNMHEERRADYPVTHAEQELTKADSRNENEYGLFSDELDEEKDERVPFRYIHEDEVVERLQAYEPKQPPSVEEVRCEINKIKEFAEFWATTLSEEYGYDKAEVLRRIKGLRLERVKECRICAGGFYASDMRRQVCDQQHGIDSEGRRSEKSACEIIDQQKYNAEYYKKSVS